MVTLIIRHANDEYIPIKYRHDKEITREGKRDAKKLAKKLINKYGYPDVIYCGPMRRTEQTMNRMRKYVGNDVKIVIDNRLSRYFTSREKRSPSIFTVTHRRNIPINETKHGFKKRCDSFLRYVKSRNHRKRQNVWIISHTMVLKRISKKLRISIPQQLDFLEYYRI